MARCCMCFSNGFLYNFHKFCCQSCTTSGPPLCVLYPGAPWNHFYFHLPQHIMHNFSSIPHFPLRYPHPKWFLLCSPWQLKMSLKHVTLYTPFPTLWSTTWCYLSAHQRQVQSHSTTTSTVKVTSMSCFSTNNPITLYHHNFRRFRAQST